MGLIVTIGLLGLGCIFAFSSKQTKFRLKNKNNKKNVYLQINVFINFGKLKPEIDMNESQKVFGNFVYIEISKSRSYIYKKISFILIVNKGVN